MIDTFQLADGKVRASQRLLLPVLPEMEGVVASRLATRNAGHLVDDYTRYIAWWTRGLVRPARRRGDLALSLGGHGPTILRLRINEGATGGINAVVAVLSIVGGLAAVAASPGGLLELRLALHSGASSGNAVLEAEVLVEQYAPFLLALPLPHAIRLGIYRGTQARLHRAIAEGFVRSVVAQIVNECGTTHHFARTY